MTPKIQHSNDNSGDAGLYTWDLATDTLYADHALAELFGLDKTLAEQGLPISKYIQRIFEEDRPTISMAIRETILTGRPFQESYRVYRSSADVTRIMAFGRCFRDNQGDPKFYAGIVFPSPEEETVDQGLLLQCCLALETANREGRNDVSALLLQALNKLIEPQQSLSTKLVGHMGSSQALRFVF